MPELPDITVYVEAIARAGRRPAARDGSVIQTPFLLRTVEPPLDVVIGKPVRAVGRLGKRIVIGLDDELSLVLHLMIAGRLHWKPSGQEGPEEERPGGVRLPERDRSRSPRPARSVARRSHSFAAATPGRDRPRRARGSRRRPSSSSRRASARRTTPSSESLTDPRLFSGIGNAYSDEILHRGAPVAGQADAAA